MLVRSFLVTSSIFCWPSHDICIWGLETTVSDKSRQVFTTPVILWKNDEDCTCAHSRSLILVPSPGQACVLLLCSLWGPLRWAEESGAPLVFGGCHFASSTSSPHCFLLETCHRKELEQTAVLGAFLFLVTRVPTHFQLWKFQTQIYTFLYIFTKNSMSSEHFSEWC